VAESQIDRRPDKFVYVPQFSMGQDTSRSLKKKYHEKSIDQVKLLELKVREQRRKNENLRL